MNPLNYASLEASQRLVDLGIVLETDFYFKEFDGEIYWPVSKREKDIYFEEVKKGYAGEGAIFIPDPSMAEVWRELPEPTTLYKYRGLTYASIFIPQEMQTIKNINPTDALIYLLSWVRKERV